ncbi:hypothetical protein C9F11_01060 [Streptomyces sp. YIM 121038]|nr:hypothetical protein C9F11_01060 [Streptomyces sp. YIM 121038]
MSRDPASAQERLCTEHLCFRPGYRGLGPGLRWSRARRPRPFICLAVVANSANGMSSELAVDGFVFVPRHCG